MQIQGEKPRFDPTVMVLAAVAVAVALVAGYQKLNPSRATYVPVPHTQYNYHPATVSLLNGW